MICFPPMVFRTPFALALVGLMATAGCARDSRAPTSLFAGASGASQDREGGNSEDGIDSEDQRHAKYSLVVVTPAPVAAEAGVVFRPQPVIEFVGRDGRFGDVDEEVTVSLIGEPGELLGRTTVLAKSRIVRFTDLQVTLPGSYTMLFSAANAIAARLPIVVRGRNDFSLAVSPTAVAITPGSSRTVMVSTSVTSGVAQTISLSLAGLPAGMTGSFSPTSVTAGQSSTLTLLASANAASVTTSATITGTAVSGAHTANLGVGVISPVPNDFAIAAVPTAKSITQGSSAIITVATAVTAGAAQSIALSISGLPSGVTGSFSPSSVTAGASATLTLSASMSAALGATIATITGVATSGAHTASVNLTVIAPAPNDFSIAAFPPGVTLSPGSSLTVHVSTVVTSGVSQSISLATSGLLSGVTGSFSPANVSAGGSSTLTLTAAAGATSGNATLSIVGTAAGGSHAAPVALIVTPRVINDFAVQAVPSSVTIKQGSSLTVSVQTAVTAGAAQSVSLSLSGLPAGVTGSISPANVTAGSSATITLNATAAAALGNASVTITGTAPSGTQTSVLSITVVAPALNDFAMTVFPGAISLARGTSLVVTVSTAVISGVSQTIALAVTGLPAGVSGVFNASSISAGGFATLTLTASAAAPAGSTNATIMGVATSGSHSGVVSITVAP